MLKKNSSLPMNERLITFKVPNNQRWNSLIPPAQLNMVERGEKIIFVANQNLYLCKPEHLEDVYRCSVVNTPKDLSVLFSEYLILSLPRLPKEKVPHRKRYNVPLRYYDHIRSWLSIFMQENPRFFSKGSLRIAVSKFFGNEFGSVSGLVIGRWLSAQKLEVKNGDATGIPLYRFKTDPMRKVLDGRKLSR